MARGIWPIRKPCMLRSRMPISASAVFLRCSSSVSPNVSNRRVRTGTHGGVAGGGGGPPPPFPAVRRVRRLSRPQIRHSKDIYFFWGEPVFTSPGPPLSLAEGCQLSADETTTPDKLPERD